MMTIDIIKKIIRENQSHIEEKYFVKKIGIFGSYARGEQKPGSDIDLLVEFSKPIDFFEFLMLEDLLSNALNKKVDLVSVKALKPRIGNYIMEEVQYI
jgi:uncharacterized protein